MEKGKWKAQRTLLIVGEGYHDVAFLQHMKSIFVMRGCGLAVTIRNAKGKGASHVIDCAIRQSSNAEYDNVAALFDTDQDWSDAVAARAKLKCIHTLKSEPCLEAMLLRALSLNCKGNSNELKKRLAKQLAGDATSHESYSQCFTREALDKTKEPAVLELIALLTQKPRR
jgi:hypothetical protein